jgi:hypothetical protein
MKNTIILIQKTDEDTSYAYEERYHQDENQFLHDISNEHITLSHKYNFMHMTNLIFRRLLG